VQPIRSEKFKQWRRDRPRSNALVLRAAPSSIVEYRLKISFTSSASSMPPLGFRRVTHRMNIPHEHASYMNFTLLNEVQNRRQGNVHRPRAGSPVLLMLMCSDNNYNHANPFRNGRGQNQSISSAIQLLFIRVLTNQYFCIVYLRLEMISIAKNCMPEVV
jgi:hypothetical protein